MNNIDMILIEMEEVVNLLPSSKLQGIVTYFNNSPLEYIEVFRNCEEDIKILVRETCSDEVWEWIEEELDLTKPINSETKYRNTIAGVPYNYID